MMGGPRPRWGIWTLALLALAGTLFLAPWSCWVAGVQLGSGAPTEGCDGMLGFDTIVFRQPEPGVTLAFMALTAVLLVEAIRRSAWPSSNDDGR